MVGMTTFEVARSTVVFLSFPFRSIFSLNCTSKRKHFLDCATLKIDTLLSLETSVNTPKHSLTSLNTRIFIYREYLQTEGWGGDRKWPEGGESYIIRNLLVQIRIIRVLFKSRKMRWTEYADVYEIVIKHRERPMHRWETDGAADLK
jgi:hypothetical protein